jgi:AcrR family transcriptional regulator
MTTTASTPSSTPPPAGTPVPTDRRSATRARLLDAALDVFAAKGLHGASVEDLATAAGFTKGALYSNFATKEELFGAVIDEQGHRMIAAVREVMSSHAHEIDDNPALSASPEADPLLAEVLTRINGIGHRWYLLESEFQLYGLRSEEGRDLYAAHCAHFRGELGGLLEELLARKGRRLTVPREQLAEIVIVVYMNQLAQQLLDIVPEGAGGLLEVVLPGLFESFTEPA